MRALEWAIQQSQRKGSKIKTPAVLGAIIQLDQCFDLLDIGHTRLLAQSAGLLIQRLAQMGSSLPDNQSAGTSDFDWLRRDRDCFVLNNVLPALEADRGVSYLSARGVFQEGEQAFDGAGIKLKSHIQIAVRDPRAIIGYFNPETHS